MGRFRLKGLVASVLCAVLAAWTPVFAGDAQVDAEGRPATAAVEADQMALRAAIAIVHKDWQTNWDRTKGFMRGYNIGSVLVDKNNPSDIKLWWARNNVGCFNNGTQHGEVRLMQQYTLKENRYYLTGATIYTTLEPCAMCSGMMVMEKVDRTVYGQHDPYYGDAIERLELNSSTLGPPPAGYTPYPPYPNPGALLSQPSTLDFYAKINQAYASYCGITPPTSCNIVAFLASDTARDLFEQETKKFKTYVPKYQENVTLQVGLLDLYAEAPGISNGRCQDPGPVGPIGFSGKGHHPKKKKAARVN